MRVLCFCLFLSLLMACSETAGGSSTGGGSEIIVVMQDSTITGTVSGLNGDYSVSLFEEEYIPEQFTQKDFISQNFEKSSSDTTFMIKGLKSGSYSLVVEDKKRGTTAFFSALELSSVEKSSLKKEFTESVSVEGDVNLQSWSDITYYLLCPGTPYYAEIDEQGRFLFSDIPAGTYSFVAVELTLFDGPEPNLIPIVSNDLKGEMITLDSTTKTITVHTKRSML